MNHLYFGDCLDVLKEIKQEHPQLFIDVIYIDKKATDAGHIKLGAAEFPMDKIQIITIEDLFANKRSGMRRREQVRGYLTEEDFYLNLKIPPR
jgi:hypothetical protein